MQFHSARELTAMLQARTLSAAELLQRAIDRIEALDPRLNAVVVRDFGRARAQAAEADKALARGDRRPLLGLPMTVKESFNVAGLPTTWGLPGTRDINVAHDAVAVARLRRAGAVILGKTNVALQLADWQAANPVYGVTNNPWDLTRTPGGSSGGSAAALAAGYVALEFGSDLAGSLRVPAHCCGVYAHKPTHGLVPLRGHAPPGTPWLTVGRDIDLAVAGPMARSASDLALALDVLAGPDDDQALAYRLALPAARHERLADYRVLVLDQHPLVPTSNEVRDALHRFVGQLEQAGCRIGWKSAALPDLAACANVFTQLLMSFIGADMPAADYGALVHAAAQLPHSAQDAAAAALRGMVCSHRDWIGTDRARIGLMHHWRQLFTQLDVVLCPVLPTVAFHHDASEMDRRVIDVDGQRVAYAAQGTWASLASAAGLPATAMPIGLSALGLPVGVQVIGPCLEDRTTIAFAELAEREFGGFIAPAEFAAAA